MIFLLKSIHIFNVEGYEGLVVFGPSAEGKKPLALLEYGNTGAYFVKSIKGTMQVLTI